MISMWQLGDESKEQRLGNAFSTGEDRLDVTLDKEGKRVLFSMDNPSSGLGELVKQYLSQNPDCASFSHNQYLGKVWGWLHGNQGVVLQFRFSDGSQHASVILDIPACSENNIRENLLRNVSAFFGNAVAEQLVSLKESLNG